MKSKAADEAFQVAVTGVAGSLHLQPARKSGSGRLLK